MNFSFDAQVVITAVEGKPRIIDPWEYQLGAVRSYNYIFNSYKNLNDQIHTHAIEIRHIAINDC